jgi:hypothetical protein
VEEAAGGIGRPRVGENGDAQIVTWLVMAGMTMMHQFQPVAALVRRKKRPQPPPDYLWTVMPWSIVPYIVMLPVPAPELEPDPPCAHALNSKTAAVAARRNFMTARSCKDRLRF